MKSNTFSHGEERITGLPTTNPRPGTKKLLLLRIACAMFTHCLYTSLDAVCVCILWIYGGGIYVKCLTSRSRLSVEEQGNGNSNRHRNKMSYEQNYKWNQGDGRWLYVRNWHTRHLRCSFTLFGFQFFFSS